MFTILNYIDLHNLQFSRPINPTVMRNREFLMMGKLFQSKEFFFVVIDFTLIIELTLLRIQATRLKVKHF